MTKVVQVEEVEVLTKPDSSCSSVQEMTGDQSEAVKSVMKVIKLIWRDPYHERAYGMFSEGVTFEFVITCLVIYGRIFY